MKRLIPFLILPFLASCFTASQPTVTTSCPAPVVKDSIVYLTKIKYDTVTSYKHDTTTKIDSITKVLVDTVAQTVTKTLYVTQYVPLYIDTTNQSQDVHFQLTPGSADNSLELQKQIDAVCLNPATTNVHVHVNHGYFTFKHGILFHNWVQARGMYFPFTIDFEGDGGTGASMDGTGTVFYFPITDCFYIGFQGAKGCKFHGITLMGIWSPQFTSPYQFYAGGGMDAAIMRNTNNDPSAAIVLDPFGPAIPTDGGYPGTDAYGNPWSTYYRGTTNGSTGCDVFDIKFIGTWISILFSPQGQTANCESMHCYNLNFDINNANCIVGCQDQEKRNHIGPGIIDWGATNIFIQIGTYGAHRRGEYEVEGVNIAGYVRQFVYDNTSGYYPINIHDCFGETLGTIGYIGGQEHCSVSRCHFDFANPIDAAFQYLYPQIQGMNTTYSDCNFRFYGMPGRWPIQIWNQDGWNTFKDCGFDDGVPVYNGYSGQPSAQMPLRDCLMQGIHYSSASGTAVAIDSTAPGFAPLYTIKDSLIGKYFQATIQCVGNELTNSHPLYVNEPLVAYDILGVQVGVAGVVTDIDVTHNSFTLCYIPPSIISGNKYGLCYWKQTLQP